MTRQTMNLQDSVEARARKLRDRFAAEGFTPIEPPILQPADTFIDMSGENIRRRLFMVQGNGREELCLRPDLTIPVARIHLETNAGKAARYCYAGPSFRRAIDETAQGHLGEFYQAGIEAFGFSDAETDMKILSLAIGAIKSEGLDNLHLNLGDPNLFQVLIDALDVPGFWRTRLLRHFWRRDLSTDLHGGLEQALTQTPDTDNARDALATALGALDQDAGAELVEDVLALAGIEPVGGRSAEEIAIRFMERAAMNAAPLPDTIIATI
ncbi:MAG: ATP phosphoribosyltransferase regulatory subunit, partial [Fimbriimonadaceae bacterium]|nr:ATP phosphoribosyltransferase regulatory subunit [Alphaproteobacteria bacterium]